MTCSFYCKSIPLIKYKQGIGDRQSGIRVLSCWNSLDHIDGSGDKNMACIRDTSQMEPKGFSIDWSKE